MTGYTVGTTLEFNRKPEGGKSAGKQVKTGQTTPKKYILWTPTSAFPGVTLS